MFVSNVNLTTLKKLITTSHTSRCFWILHFEHCIASFFILFFSPTRKKFTCQVFLKRNVLEWLLKLSEEVPGETSDQIIVCVHRQILQTKLKATTKIKKLNLLVRFVVPTPEPSLAALVYVVAPFSGCTKGESSLHQRNTSLSVWDTAV